MHFGFDPLLPPAVLVPAALACLALVLWLYWRWKPMVSPRYWGLLLGVKLVSLTLLLLLLLNPYRLERRPDTRNYRVVFLIDATGSMATRDCGPLSRLEVVTQQILKADSSFATHVLDKYPNARFYLFAGSQLRRLDRQTDFEILPGDTDIDPVLQKVFNAGGGRFKLGAVVLVSDGCDNRELSLIEGAAPYRKANIPVHCLGIGDRRPKPDLAVRWTRTPKKAVKGKPFRLEGSVKRNTRGKMAVTVELFERTRLVARQVVHFSEKEKAKQVEFEHSAFVAGFKTYKLRAAALPQEENTLNNLDYASFRVADPDVFRILYFSGNLDWDFKYLNLLAQEQDRLRLDALIRTGETTWLNRGFPQDKPTRGFPEPAVINEYDCLIINLNSLYLLDARGLKALTSFIENRGGGVIFTGMTAEIPKTVQRLLPVKSLPAELTRLGKAKLEFRPSLVLSAGRLDTVRELADRLYLPAESAFLPIGAADLKPGAQAVAVIEGVGWVALAAQNYGSGKVAFLNLADSWKWVMHSDSGAHYYGLFWGRLISWVSSSSKERLTLKPAGAKLPLNVPREFVVDVLDKNYATDNQAKVSGMLVLPDGGEQTLHFFNSPRVDGRYTAKFVPRLPGEYRISIRAQLKSGEALESAADYLGADASTESQPAPMAEQQLQSLARLTGGTYWNYRKLDSIRHLPLTKELHYLERRRNFRRSWLFLLLVILCILPDWILRRRIGLR